MTTVLQTNSTGLPCEAVFVNRKMIWGLLQPYHLRQGFSWRKKQIYAPPPFKNYSFSFMETPLYGYSFPQIILYPVFGTNFYPNLLGYTVLQQQQTQNVGYSDCRTLRLYQFSDSLVALPLSKSTIWQMTTVRLYFNVELYTNLNIYFNSIVTLILFHNRRESFWVLVLRFLENVHSHYSCHYE